MASNITIEDEGSDVEKDLSPNIPKNFYPDTNVAINSYTGNRNMLLYLLPKPEELDVKNFEANLYLLEGESQEPPEDYVMLRCKKAIASILSEHNVIPFIMSHPSNNRVDVHVPAHHMEAVIRDIILDRENLDLDLAVISVQPLKASSQGIKPLSCHVKKMLLKSDGWTVESSVFCELIVRAVEMGIDGRPYPVIYCVIPAHLMLSLEQDQMLVEANGDSSHLREHVKVQMKEQRYVFKNSNHQESVILQPPPLIAYRLWDFKDAREASSLEIQLDGDEKRSKTDRQEESISFMNDIALLKLSSYRHDEFADDTRLFPIYEKRQIVILARRKQRIVVGDFEGRLIYPPEGMTSTNHCFGLHLAFILTSKDSSGKTHKLTEGSSGLVVFFKGKRNQLIPVGMLVGELDVDLPDSSDSSIYQAVVLSEALKEIGHSYPRQLPDLHLLETCHQSPGKEEVPRYGIGDGEVSQPLASTVFEPQRVLPIVAVERVSGDTAMEQPRNEIVAEDTKSEISVATDEGYTTGNTMSAEDSRVAVSVKEIECKTDKVHLDTDTTAEVTKSYSEELSLSPDRKGEEDSAHDVRCENAKCLTRMEEIEMERDRYMVRCKELEKELAAQEIARVAKELEPKENYLTANKLNEEDEQDKLMTLKSTEKELEVKKDYLTANKLNKEHEQKNAEQYDKVRILRSKAKEHMCPPKWTKTPTATGTKMVEIRHGQWQDNGVPYVAYMERLEESSPIEPGVTIKGDVITIIHGGQYGKASETKYKVKMEVQKIVAKINGMHNETKGVVLQDSYFQTDEPDTEDISGAKGGEAYIEDMPLHLRLDFDSDAQSKKQPIQCKEKVCDN